jgi:hypothetical protein
MKVIYFIIEDKKVLEHKTIASFDFERKHESEINSQIESAFDWILSFRINFSRCFDDLSLLNKIQCFEMERSRERGGNYGPDFLCELSFLLNLE